MEITKASIETILKTTTNESLDEDLKDVELAVSMFLNSHIKQAESHLKQKYGLTLYHTFGTAILATLKSLMTHDKADTEYALTSLQHALLVAQSFKPTSFLSSLFFGKDFGSLTRVQKHAQVICAEVCLFTAFLNLITEKNIVGFVKEGLAIRASYQDFKSFYRVLKSKALEDFDMDLIVSIYNGFGAFNMTLGLIPEKILKVFEVFGFGGRRHLGLNCLEIAAGWPKSEFKPSARNAKKVVNVIQDVDLKGPGTRMFMADLFLLVYHIELSAMIQVPGCNLQLGKQMLQRNLDTYPDSIIYLTLLGKSLQTEAQPAEAIKVLTRVINIQQDWKQLAHICYWDLGLCHALLGEWDKAANYFDLLYKENNWSPSVYLYLNAIFLYQHDPVANLQQAIEKCKQIPTLLKKIGGKSIPIEKFVCRKSRKFLEQGNRLLLAGYEILYMVLTFK